MYSEKYNASAQRVLVAGPAYSHVSWPGYAPGKSRSFLLASIRLGIFVLGILSPRTFILGEVTS